jgi:Tol biopolymer transport system component
VSPDGRVIAFATSDNRTRLYPVDGGEPTLLPGAEPGEVAVQWSEDGRWVYVRQFGELPVTVHRLDVHAGQREL